MDPEIKGLLQKNLALAEENNRLLRGLRRANRISAIWKLVYFVLFLGSLAYAYVYAKPYLDQAMATYDSLLETQTNVKDSFKNFFPGGE